MKWMSINEMSPLDAALRYADDGHPVVPFHTTENGICTCRNRKCKSPGKHPRFKKGLLEHGLKKAEEPEDETSADCEDGSS